MTNRYVCLAGSIVLSGSLLLLSGCGGGANEPTPSPAATEQASPSASGAESAAQPSAAPDAQAEAKDIFSTRCASCHGDDGRGDGPASTVLNPKPRNFHDPKWQESVTDETLSQAIVYGGAAVSKSPAMAANPDLQEKPDVVKALIAHIRDLGKQK